MFASRFTASHWRTRLADIASVGFLGSLLVVMVALLLGGPTQPSLIHTQWQLEQVGQHRVAQTHHKHPPYLQLLNQDGRLRGAVNGHALTGRYVQLGDPRQLHLKAHPTGQSAGPADAPLEKAYLHALARTRGETIEGSHLVLRDLDGHALARLHAIKPS